MSSFKAFKSTIKKKKFFKVFLSFEIDFYTFNGLETFE